MGLFGFGKKKKKQSVESQEIRKQFYALNSRKYPRYLVANLQSSRGEVIDVAQRSLRISSQRLNVGDRLEILLDTLRLVVEVVRSEGGKVGVVAEEEIPYELILKYQRRLEFSNFSAKSILDLQESERGEELEIRRAIVNLMLEIDDPNTDISRFKEHVEAVEPLKEKILTMANSVEVAGRGYVKDVASAISRLGFDKVRKIVYDFIIYDVTLSHDEIEKFRNFEAYNLLFNAFFKKLAPLFNFKDHKNEGRSLITMNNMGAIILAKEAPVLKDYYEGVSKLFSIEMRLLEKRECGCDFFELNKTYFLDYLGVFRYIYDGFVLSFFMFHPHYKPNKIKISLSQRKLRYAYIVYLSILAMRYLLDNDRNSGYIFFHRLKHLGFALDDVKGLLVELVEGVNKRLFTIGVEQQIKIPDFPSWNVSLERILGSGVYVSYLLDKWQEFSENGDRFAIRFEDEMYAHRVLELLLNHDSFSFLSDSFCVVPCDILEDEDISLATFEGFDLVVFRNIHKLKNSLIKDFMKIWRDFEGKIVVTFSNDTFFEYRNPDLFNLFNKQMVDFPSYFQSAVIHSKMVTNCCTELNRFFGKKICAIEEFKSIEQSMQSVYAKVMERF